MWHQITFISARDAYSTLFQNSLLTQLKMDENNIRDSGVKMLANGNLTNLTVLSLVNCNITSEGCKYLNNLNLSKLTELYLNDNAVTADEVEYFVNGKLFLSKTEPRWKQYRRRIQLFDTTFFVTLSSVSRI